MDLYLSYTVELVYSVISDCINREVAAPLKRVFWCMDFATSGGGGLKLSGCNKEVATFSTHSDNYTQVRLWYCSSLYGDSY